MNNKFMLVGGQIAIVIFMLNAIYSLFIESDKLLFLEYFQTAVLFIILLVLVKTKQVSKPDSKQTSD